MGRLQRLFPAFCRNLYQFSDRFLFFLKPPKNEDETKPFNPHDHAFKIQSLKYFLYSRSFDPKLNRMRSDQLKNSIHILIPRFIKGTQLETLSTFMEGNGIDQVNFESAVKVGAKVILDLNDGTGNLKNLDGIKDEVVAARQMYNHADLRIQLDQPNHIFKEI